MRRIFFLFCALAPLVSEAVPPKVALVRVGDVYRQLPSTKTEQESIRNMRAKILEDRRAEELRKLITELQALHAEIQRLGETAGADAGRRGTLMRDYEIKRSNMQSVQQDFEAFRVEQDQMINRKMVELMRASLNRIFSEAQKLGKEQGFDVVMDSSGNTNTGLPFILYSKNAKDLTDEVGKALGVTQPAAAEATPPAGETPTKP